VDVLRKLKDEEIAILRRLASNNDFLVLMGVFDDTLQLLRENSDTLLDDKLVYVSKGQRQVLASIVNLMSEEGIRDISNKAKSRRQ
jgi:hypothetical protein